MQEVINTPLEGSDIEFDRRHLWHPYTSMVAPLLCYEVSKCDGVYIELINGERLIDGMSSWWSAIHGYNNTRLNEAAKRQIDAMSHVMFGGLTHKPAVELGRKLVQVTPDGLDYVFLADSGSISVEVALKMALQYWVDRGEDGAPRTKFLTIKGGYHGDTWHCMSVCDPQGGMHTVWNGRLPEQVFAERPKTTFYEHWSEANPNAISDLAELDRVFSENAGQLAAVVVEPIVQGAGGVYFYNPQYLRELKRRCDKQGVLLIFDEIATGFGRTGKMFASQWADVIPDIMTVGKALTGGYMTLAATIANKKVAHGIRGAFMHGPTFMGNPLACAVACESLDIIGEGEILGKVANIERILKVELKSAREFESVVDVRVLGAIGVVEMKSDVDMESIQREFVKRGVWVRPFGKLIYVMPQYVIEDEELIFLARAVVEVVSGL